MNRTMALEPTPETSLLADIKYVGEAIGAVITAVTLIVGIAFRKRVWTAAGAVFRWLKAFVMAPLMVAEMREQLRMKDGQGFPAWAEGVDSSLIGVRRMLAHETSLRRAAMQNLSDAMFEADARGRFLWANRVFLTEASVNLDDVRGDNWQNIVLLRDRDDFVETWNRQIAAGNHFRGKFRLNTDGEQWMAFDATCNRDELGQVIGYLGYMRPTPDPRLHTTDS